MWTSLGECVRFDVKSRSCEQNNRLISIHNIEVCQPLASQLPQYHIDLAWLCTPWINLLVICNFALCNLQVLTSEVRATSFITLNLLGSDFRLSECVNVVDQRRTLSSSWDLVRFSWLEKGEQGQRG